MNELLDELRELYDQSPGFAILATVWLVLRTLGTMQTQQAEGDKDTLTAREVVDLVRAALGEPHQTNNEALLKRLDELSSQIEQLKQERQTQ